MARDKYIFDAYWIAPWITQMTFINFIVFEVKKVTVHRKYHLFLFGTSQFSQNTSLTVTWPSPKNHNLGHIDKCTSLTHLLTVQSFVLFSFIVAYLIVYDKLQLSEVEKISLKLINILVSGISFVLCSRYYILSLFAIFSCSYKCIFCCILPTLQLKTGCMFKSGLKHHHQEMNHVSQVGVLVDNLTPVHQKKTMCTLKEKYCLKYEILKNVSHKTWFDIICKYRYKNVELRSV